MYSFDSRIRYSECDGQGRLSLTALVNYLQDCVTFHSKEMDATVKDVQGGSLAWFLSAWQIAIDRLPRFAEEIRVSTWCYEMGRVDARRNVVIETVDGESLVRADSVWFVFDAQTNKPVRIPDSEHRYVEDRPRLDLPPTQRKLSLEGPEATARPLTVTLAHLDTNRHVNNAQYLKMADDALAELEGITAQDLSLRRVCVQYRQMALLGDTIVPHVHTTGDARIVNLADPAGNPHTIVRLETDQGPLGLSSCLCEKGRP